MAGRPYETATQKSRRLDQELDSWLAQKRWRKHSSTNSLGEPDLSIEDVARYALKVFGLIAAALALMWVGAQLLAP